VGMKAFRNSASCKKARDLTVACYAATEGFPEEESCGLASDIRTSATLIVTNLVRAFRSQTVDEGKRRLQKAISLATRLEYYLLISRDLDLMRSADYDYLQSQVAQMKRQLARLLGRMVLKRKRSRS
jgi:four helix bundle protein